MIKPSLSARKKSHCTRRSLLKCGGLGLVVGALGANEYPAYPGPVPDEDRFTERLSGLDEAEDLSLLERFLLSLPELQVQPRGVSATSIANRVQLNQQLNEELSQTAVAHLVSTAFPSVVRYPAWLAVAVGLELFEVVLQNSQLPAFELPGVSREHVLPFTALIDLALIPLCRLLRDPEAPFSSEIQMVVETRISDLRGRLVLLGDDTFIGIAEDLNRMLARGTSPTLVKTSVHVISDMSNPPFSSSYEQDLRFGQMNWSFWATHGEWEKIIDKQNRAIDKVIMSLLIGQLFERCE